MASWELTMRGKPQNDEQRGEEERETGVAERREKTWKEEGGRLH